MSKTTMYTTTPDDIHEDRILVPWDSDLPFFRSIYKKDNDDNEPQNIGGHSFTFEIYRSRYELKSPTAQPLITWEDADFDKVQEPDADHNVTNTLYRLIQWEDLDLMRHSLDYYYRLMGADLDGKRFYVDHGEIRKGRRE